MKANGSYTVGGVRYPRPFKIRRLGHFGFNLGALEKGLDFYGRLLGFRVTDELDFSKIPGLEDQARSLDDPRLFFMTHGPDHHALLLAHRSLGAMFGDDAVSRDVTVNQITWQVGSMEEVFQAADYFRGNEVEIRRVGRDMPGSNWHTYIRDPDGHTVELYYGIEQIGWDGRSKPHAMYDRRFTEAPELPQIAERTEVADALARGVDIHSGYAVHDIGSGDHVVAGIRLPRPFKITKIGPIGLFVADVGAAQAFYIDVMGFILTEEVTYKGHRCVFLRCGTEHHSLALYPRALRPLLGLSEHTSCMSMGFEVGSYQQLRDAVAFLGKEGVRSAGTIPPELYPGVDYAAHVLDPDGHCLMLYYYMEQIGWDGKPRPAALRRQVRGDWPDVIDPLSDTYADQTFQGPLG
ncbi:VOC family protein [Reyranella sp. CPCC 100927]|uniref:VOC family protein n=1 Tax=Reyranella sp. CPCC 100927 TaxID=2599616 RepID=UPI0011B50570|nr:VOC family protein [Reyranella sp. CPCC 100927]TWT12918.1 extradiol dioxygenase [Reyranella sp. CPCC 100927]